MDSNRSSSIPISQSNRSNSTSKQASSKRVKFDDDSAGNWVPAKGTYEFEEELSEDIYISTTVTLCKYLRSWNKYKPSEEENDSKIWLRDVALMIFLSIFTLSVQFYITLLLWRTYGLNQIYKPIYQDPNEYERQLLAPLTDFYYRENERFFLSECFKYYESQEFQEQTFDNRDLDHQLHFICKCDIF